MALYEINEIEECYDLLEAEIIALAIKHNALVESMSLMWSQILRTTSDPLTRRLCTQRLNELNSMLHSYPVEPYE